MNSLPINDRIVEQGRLAIESLMTGRMNAYAYGSQTNEYGLTRYSERIKYLENIPCRLSYQDKKPAEGNAPAEADREIRVAFPIYYDILPGSVLEIEFLGKTRLYKQAGRVHVNDFRKKMVLELLEEHINENDF